MRKLFLLALSALLIIGLNACKPKGEETRPEALPGTQFRRDAILSVSAPDGSLRTTFEVEIAATPNATRQGLMYRAEMAPNRGMLFDFQGLTNTTFWMKNTYIPLDVVFIDEDSRILSIASDAKPFSTDKIPPGGIYRYALEINAGQAKQHNLTIGDKIEWTTELSE